MNERYKQVITLGYFALVAVSLVVVAMIVLFRPDATAALMSFVGTVLAVASTAAVTFYMLGKQNQEIAAVKESAASVKEDTSTVKQQTNGTLTRLLDRVVELELAAKEKEKK